MPSRSLVLRDGMRCRLLQARDAAFTAIVYLRRFPTQVIGVEATSFVTKVADLSVFTWVPSFVSDEGNDMKEVGIEFGTSSLR
jgi:hypothetical protein